MKVGSVWFVLNKSRHDGSIPNANQYGSMCDQILYIDQKYFSIKINFNQNGSILLNADQCWITLTVQEMVSDFFILHFFPIKTVPDQGLTIVWHSFDREKMQDEKI